MAYIGSTPTSQNFTSGTDYFSGTGSQTDYTLTRTVNSVNDIEVVINNVVQQPSTAYTLSGTTITFTSAPSSGTNNIYVRYLATNMQSFTVPANSITRSQLDSNLQAGFQGRNRIINGHMVVDQRNAGASVTPNNTYTLDRWYYQNSQTGKATVQQNAGSVTPPAGFTNYLGITSTSAYSVGTSDYFALVQPIEGFNVGDLNFGSANAKTITLSFWVRSSLTGTFGGVVSNGADARSYPFAYTISSANTWTQASVTIAGDTTGTWATNNTAGMKVYFGLGCGSSLSATAGSWSAGNYLSATGATSVVGTSGATFYITGVQLEEGTTATSFEREAYSVILQKCQRYFAKLGGTTLGEGLGAGNIQDAANSGWFYVKYPVTMRTAPTAAYSSLRATNNADYNLTVSSIRGQTNGVDSSNMGFNFSSSGTTYAAVQLQTSATAGFLSFSSEL